MRWVKRDLAAAGAGQVVVDDDAVVDQQLGRDGAHARRGRDARGWLSMLATTRAAAPRRRCTSTSEPPVGRVACGRRNVAGQWGRRGGGLWARTRRGGAARTPPVRGRAAGCAGARLCGCGRGGGSVLRGRCGGGVLSGGVLAWRRSRWRRSRLRRSRVTVPWAAAGAAAGQSDAARPDALTVRRLPVRRRLAGAPAGGALPVRRLGRLVVREELPPGRIHRVLVRQVLLVQLVDEPLVGTELRVVGCALRHGVVRLLPVLARHPAGASTLT